MTHSSSAAFIRDSFVGLTLGWISAGLLLCVMNSSFRKLNEGVCWLPPCWVRYCYLFDTHGFCSRKSGFGLVTVVFFWPCFGYL